MIRVPGTRRRMGVVRVLYGLLGLILVPFGVIWLVGSEYLRGGIALGFGAFVLVTTLYDGWWTVDWGDQTDE